MQGQELNGSSVHPNVGSESRHAMWLEYARRATGSRGIVAGAEDDDDEDEDDEDDEGGFTVPELLRENRKLRKENARRRTENKDLRTQLDKAQSEAISSDEKVQARVTELERQNSTLSAENVKLRASASLMETVGNSDIRFRDPQVAMKLIDPDEFMDEEGNVDTKALKRELKALAKRVPYLLVEETQSNSDSDDESEEEEESQPTNDVDADTTTTGSGDTGAGRKTTNRVGSRRLAQQKLLDDSIEDLVAAGRIRIPD